MHNILPIVWMVNIMPTTVTLVSSINSYVCVILDFRALNNQQKAQRVPVYTLHSTQSSYYAQA